MNDEVIYMCPDKVFRTRDEINKTNGHHLFSNYTFWKDRASRKHKVHDVGNNMGDRKKKTREQN